MPRTSDAADLEKLTPGRVRELVLARLAATGPGHSLACLAKPYTKGGAFRPCSDGRCPSPPMDWRPPQVLSEVMQALVLEKKVERFGTYYWLRQDSPKR